MYHSVFLQFKKQLGQMDKWFDAAVAHAEQRSFAPDLLLPVRLAPDQFPLLMQVQIATDTAKLGAARLTGKDAPKHADDEKTFDELRARVKSVIAYLDTLTEADFAGAAERSVTQPRWEGKTMSGRDYFLEHVMPNFFFHASHAYAILRHSGVKLGKRDYLGTLSLRPPA